MTGTLPLAMAALLVVAACSSSDDTETTWADERRAELAAESADAEDFCARTVTNRLKAPATARFVDVHAEAAVVRHGDDAPDSAAAYVVVGAVDAEDGYGAFIRTGFTCRAL